MSSLLARIAQAPAHSPVRAKFFLALSASSSAASVVNATDPLSTLMTTTDFGDATSAGLLVQYALYKDMGREVIVTDADGNHIQKWRAVQRVNDAATEGVAADPDMYVLVWSAAGGADVLVVRTG